MAVNEKLHTEKIKLANINLLVISLIPKPIVKESMLTLNAKNIKLIKLIFIFNSSFLKYCIAKFTPRIIRIKPKTILLAILK